MGEPPHGQPSPAPWPSSPIPLLENNVAEARPKKPSPNYPMAPTVSAPGSLCCPGLGREAPGTQISNLLPLDPDSCVPAMTLKWAAW